ncbi:MAG: hypothetical protein ABF335_06955 [Alphaproteobacteria bacterium]
MTQNGFSLKVVIPLLIIVTTAFFVAFGAVIGGLFWQWEQVGQVMEDDAPAVSDPASTEQTATEIAPPLE